VSLKFHRPWSQGSSSGAGGGAAAAKQVKWFNKCSWTCQICGTTVTTNSSAFFKHVAEHQVPYWKGGAGGDHEISLECCEMVRKLFKNKLEVGSLSYVFCFVLKDNFLQCCASVKFGPYRYL
jgi:hypothetical protein